MFNVQAVCSKDRKLVKSFPIACYSFSSKYFQLSGGFKSGGFLLVISHRATLVLIGDIQYFCCLCKKVFGLLTDLNSFSSVYMLI